MDFVLVLDSISSSFHAHNPLLLSAHSIMDDASELSAALSSIAMDAQPSCIQFCKKYPGYFVVGTYQLDEASDDATKTSEGTADPMDVDKDDEGKQTSAPAQNRSGSLQLFRLQDHGSMYATRFSFQRPFSFRMLNIIQRASSDCINFRHPFHSLFTSRRRTPRCCNKRWLRTFVRSEP